MASPMQRHRHRDPYSLQISDGLNNGGVGIADRIVCAGLWHGQPLPMYCVYSTHCGRSGKAMLGKAIDGDSGPQANGRETSERG
jgi:hypothetical protein